MTTLETGQITTPRTSRRRRAAPVRRTPRLGLLYAWLVGIAVVGFVAWRIARLGYNPTDEGLITTESLRILHGQVPHADFVTARPVGSALLHIVDVVLPTPLVLTSRIISLGEFALYTALLARLAFGRRMREWSVPQAAAVVGAFLVNIHTQPLMAWHTTDGLLLVSLGLVAVRTATASNRPISLLLGMTALGAAAIVKQSFAPAAVMGLVLVVAHDPRRPKRVLLAALAAAAPLVAYASWVGLAGGAADMVHQLTDAKRPSFVPLFAVYRHQSLGGVVIGAAAIVLAAIVTRFARHPRQHSALTWQAADLVARLVATGVVLHVAFEQHLLEAVGRELFATWGTSLAWLLVVQLLIDGRSKGRVEALLILAVGWMTSLSWGYPVPNLVGGSIALVILYRVWQDPPQFEIVARRRLVPAIAALATIGVTVVVMVSFLHARTTYVYRDLPASDLTSDLGSLSSELAGIRTNPSTFAYIENVIDCVRQYPARDVAILPANAGLYAILQLHNPFSLDWAWTDELVADAPDRLLADARSVSRRGNYLVLFDTFPVEQIAYYPPLPAVTDVDDPPYFYNLSLGTEIRDSLHGARIECGSLVGVYQPWLTTTP